MNKLVTIVMLFAAGKLFAATGDTTKINVWDKFSMNRYGSFDKKVLLADGAKKYQRIWLKYTLGCESNGQCEWDYTLKLFTRQHTGKMDSTIKQAPYLKVNGTAIDSIVYSSDSTWVNRYNAITKQTDSVLAATIKITLFGDTLNPIVLTDSILGFTANYWRFWFDTTGKKTDSVFVSSNKVIKQKFTPYYDVFEIINNIELGRFISPYAKTFPKSFKYDYVYDVTDYAKYITDSSELRIEYQGYSYGFTATWDMIYVEGTPAKEVIDVVNIYNGGFNYGQAVSIEQALSAKTFTVPTGATSTKARVIITGHGGESNQNCAEFCPKKMYLKLNNSQIAEQMVWKDDCGSNAIPAQPGTWVYNRANWCPGEKIRNFDYMLNVAAQSTNTIDLDMEAFTANGGASYNLALQLIYYKQHNYTNEASVEEILAPTNAFWHNKTNPACIEGKVRIKNWGSQPLTSALVAYQLGNAASREITWTGNLAYDAEADVVLPNLLWPTDLTNRTFKVWFKQINGQANDGNALNDLATSTFDLPLTFPNKFMVETRTNAVPAQNNYTITDDQGKVIFTKTFTTPGTLHRDTFNLKWGCYTFKFNDEAGNGLGWWAAPSEGNGTLRITVPGSIPTQVLRTFNVDFGSFTQINFRVQHPVGMATNAIDEAMVNIYPNPVNNILEVEGMQVAQIELFDLTGKRVKLVTLSNQLSTQQIGNGIYLIKLTNANGQQLTRKVVVSH